MKENSAKQLSLLSAGNTWKLPEWAEQDKRQRKGKRTNKKLTADLIHISFVYKTLKFVLIYKKYVMSQYFKYFSEGSIFLYLFKKCS